MEDQEQLLHEKIAELESIEEEIRQLNESLEVRVEDRTKELSTALDELKKAQQQLVHTEKMASLGQLVAGVAHEINTPIGAVKASASNIQDVLSFVFLDLPTFCQSFTDAEQVLIQSLLRTALETDNDFGTAEERKLRKALQKTLEANNVENPDDIARKLVELGVIEGVETYLPLLKHAQSEAILDLVYKAGMIKINLKNISIAAEKTKRTVFALKTYSYKETSDKPVPVNLSENINVILTLYENQMKYNVEVNKSIDDEVCILGNSDEVGQVWTNLIHNALQAMNHKGEMTVTCKRQNNQAVVEIADNGPGIPPEIADKIFDPFFTTKKRGEGTGLGLSICKEIIEKNGGQLTFRSQPGATCFRVTFPLLSQPEAKTLPARTRESVAA